jgi:hypothetical protein
MVDLATSILKDFSQTYFEKISLMNGDEVLQYNKTVMGITALPLGSNMNDAIRWNDAVRNGGLKFRVEPRKGYKLLTYYK